MAEFSDGYQIKAKDVEPGMKVYTAKGWFNINAFKIDGEVVSMNLSAPFSGWVDVSFPIETLIWVDRQGTLGHKHSHLLTNDSSQPGHKKENKMPTDVDTGFGLGSM